MDVQLDLIKGRFLSKNSNLDSYRKSDGFPKTKESLNFKNNKGLTGDGVVFLVDGCVLLEELDIGWW